MKKICIFLLAIKNDGSLWVWGDNRFGQLGNNSKHAAFSPINITEFYEFK